MRSLEGCAVKTMQLVSEMMNKAHIAVPELPVIPKSHDDLFLSPAKSSIGERECVCGQRCLCNFIAKVRYGPETDKGFVCKEFLLPQQHADFLDGKGLPALRGKCLVCLRYFVNYLYILVSAHSNPRITHTTQMGSLALGNASSTNGT